MNSVTISNQTREKLRIALWTKKIKDLDQFQPFHDMKLINPGKESFDLPEDAGLDNLHVALTKDHVYKTGKLGFKDVLESDLIDVKAGGQVEVKGSYTRGYDILVK